MNKSAIATKKPIASLFGILLLCGHAAAQQVGYAIFDMKTFGGPTASAEGINEQFTVAGFARADQVNNRAAMWMSDHLVDLDPSAPCCSNFALDINDRGDIVGQRSGGSGAVFWPSDGKWIELGTLGGRFVSTANAINESRQIVGASFLPDDSKHPFLWEDGVMTDLGTFGGAKGEAYDINNLAQVVGTAWVVDGDTHPFLWENGNLQDLGLLPGGNDGAALGINDAGLIVGYSYNVVEDDRAVKWENGAIVDLHDPSVADWSDAVAVNADGVIVGNMGLVHSSRVTGFIIENGRMVDLNSFLPPHRARDIEIVNDINDAGAIVGNTRGEPRRGMILIPVTPTLNLSDPLPGGLGRNNRLTVTGATPGQRIYFVYGLRGGGTVIPGCDLQTGAAAQIDDPVIIGTAVANSNGEASITRFVPNSAAGHDILIQAIQKDGCKVSQLVVHRFD